MIIGSNNRIEKFQQTGTVAKKEEDTNLLSITDKVEINKEGKSEEQNFLEKTAGKIKDFYNKSIAGTYNLGEADFPKGQVVQITRELVEKKPAVKEEIGAVKSYGWFPGGSVGEEKLSILVKGEKGEGTLETELVKKDGQWNFTSAVFYRKNSDKEIDLLKEN